MQPFKNRKNLAINGGEIAFLFFILTRLVALILSFPCISDVLLYLNIFINLHQGATPYQEFTFEYPPLALAVIYLSGISLESNDFTPYYLCFAMLMFFCDFCCLKTCQTYCKNRLLMNERDITFMTVLYSLFGLILFRILYHRLDIIVAIFFAASLLFFQAKNPRLTKQIFINGLLGFFYKIVPAFTIPAAIILKAFLAPTLKKNLIKIALNSVIFISCIAAIILSLEIYSQHNFIKNMLLHDQRGVQVESTYSSFLMMFDFLANRQSNIFLSSTGYDILVNPFFGKILKHLGNIILIGFFCGLFLKLLRQKKLHREFKISEEVFLDATLITILLFLSFQRVLSAQFFIWLIPISSIWLAKNRSILFLLAFSFLFLATFFIFSIDYYSLICQVPIIVITLFLRNLCLLIVTCLITLKFFTNDLRN